RADGGDRHVRAQTVCDLHNAPPLTATYLPRCEPFLHNVPELRIAAVLRVQLQRRGAAAGGSRWVRGRRGGAAVAAAERRGPAAGALVPRRRLPPVRDAHA